MKKLPNTVNVDCLLNLGGKNGVIWRVKVLALLILFGWQTCIPAAEFHSITPAAVAALSPYNVHHPVITLSALSGDGRTIAGQITETGVDYDCTKFDCGTRPFTWSINDPSTRRIIMTDTFPISETQAKSWPPYRINALTHDGAGALLVSEFRHFETVIERDGQTQLLRPVIDSSDWLWATGISANAEVVVGDLGPHPFRWDAANGLQPISGLPSDHPFTATAVSGDGEVVVLNAFPGVASQRLNLGGNQTTGNAYRWVASAGLQELPPLAGDTHSYAVAPSFDGATIVGNSLVNTSQTFVRYRAVRWRGFVPSPLGGIPGYDLSIAQDLTADGNTAVGSVYNQPPSALYGRWFESRQNAIIGFNPPIDKYHKAVLWDADGNAFDLKDLLVSQYGLATQLDGWKLTEASAISDDGSVIVGSGINPEGVRAIWIASLAVPEPSTTGMLIVLLAVVSNYSRALRKQW